MLLEGKIFRYFPVGIVLKVVVVVIREGNSNKGELEVYGKPTGGSKDSGEDFVVICRGNGEVSFDVVSSASSNDHTTTFSCLDRVIFYN